MRFLKPLFYIVAFIRAIIIFGSILIFLLLYTLSRVIIKHNERRAFMLRKNWLRWIAIPVLNIKIRKKGDPINIPALYVSNHRSFADPIVLCRFLDAFVIAKAEVASYPIINKGAELTGIVYVKRENKDSRNTTREKMVSLVKNGYNVLVYPEGTVGKEKGTLEFKKGTFIEAAKNNFPVVPVTIEFSHPEDMWTIPNFILQYFKQFSKWRTEVKLHFGDPIRHEDGIQLANIAHTQINQQLSIMQKDWSRVF